LSFVAESSASGPQSGKAPYHSLPLPYINIYIYISLRSTRKGARSKGVKLDGYKGKKESVFFYLREIL
jgi:hypothetical protein